MTPQRFDIAVIGAGIVGIACAYYLALRQRPGRIVLVERGEPMGLTSAASGENYRNWWPHPVMTAFTDHSIDLMEQLARDSGDRIHMTRRGYALATRAAKPDKLLRELHAGYGSEGAARIRVHETGAAATYRPADAADWREAPDGVDVLSGKALVRRHFRSFAPDIETVLHIRRAGGIGGHGLGSLMLETVRAKGGSLLAGRLVGIEHGEGFLLRLKAAEGPKSLVADVVVNAAGPHLAEIAAMLGETLSVANVFQQKIAFPDHEGAIPRDLPFSIDLDGGTIDWTEEEKAVLREDSATRWLAEPMPGGIHCRPDGSGAGKWIKLGWAFNRTPSQPVAEPPTDPQFPEIVLRAASRLNPSLKAYYGRLPRQMAHYGGYYTMTKENWPLIGPLQVDGAFVAGALSGFGTMGACAAGALIARWVRGEPQPAFAKALSPARHADKTLMASLLASANKGVL